MDESRNTSFLGITKGHTTLYDNQVDQAQLKACVRYVPGSVYQRFNSNNRCNHQKVNTKFVLGGVACGMGKVTDDSILCPRCGKVTTTHHVVVR